MLFNSYIFVLLFLPLCVAGYFFLGRINNNVSMVFLIGMSLWFYGYYNPKYLTVICLSIVLNFGLSKFIRKLSGSLSKTVMIIGISLNAASIFYFKYYDFFIRNVNKLFGTDFKLLKILLPLGISFFTFQQIAYLVDTFKGQTEDYGFIEYALFVVFFPQLIAGPIVLHKEVIPQFRDEKNRSIDFENIAGGLWVFAVGLAKKVLIADVFSVVVSYGFRNIEDLCSLEAFIVSICYTFQIYFDFSGYCDMAVGIGQMFNIKLPQNFNSPYKACSIVDFWSRWHMTLTRFLREYIYFPLGGNKKGIVRAYLNIMVVFLVSGIWHGANWTFILWGILHGMLNILTRMFSKTWEKVNRVIKWAVTFMLVDLLWVFFRADWISDAVKLIRRIFSFDRIVPDETFLNCFKTTEIRLLEKIGFIEIISQRTPWAWMVLFIAAAFLIVLGYKNMFEIEHKITIKRSIATIILLFGSIVSFAGVSEFLYFGF